MRLKRGGRWGYSLIIWQFCLFVIQGFQWAKISVTAGLSQRIINLKSPYNIFQISLPTFGIYRYPNNTRIRTYGLLLGIAKSQIWFTNFLYIMAIWPSMIPFFYICESIVKTSACYCFKVDFINIFPYVYDQKQRIRTLIGRGINEFKELIL